MTFHRAIGEKAHYFARVLPDDAKGDCEVYLAEPDRRSVAGYATLGFSPARPFANRAVFWMEVRLPSRKTGLGGALLDRVVSSVRESGLRRLTVARKIDVESEGARFLKGRGFTLDAYQHYWEASNQAVIDVYKDLYRKLVARGKVPSDAKIVPLTEVSPEALYPIVANNMGFSPAETLERMRGGPSGFSRTLSKVLIVGGEPMGAVLAASNGTFAYCHANALAPTLRGGWASMMLKLAFCSHLMERGFPTFRFNADPVLHPDTDKTARRGGARLLKTLGEYSLQL